MSAGTNGELEKRIVEAVRTSSDRAEQHILFYRWRFRAHVFSHFLTLDDLVHLVFEGERRSSPARLVLDLIEEDAGWQGLRRLKDGWRRRFEPFPEYQNSIHAEYGTIYLAALREME